MTFGCHDTQNGTTMPPSLCTSNGFELVVVANMKRTRTPQNSVPFHSDVVGVATLVTTATTSGSEDALNVQWLE